MALAVFAVKRFASAVIVLFLVSILTFVIFVDLPNGDPAARLAGKTSTAADIANIRHAYGFDRPVYVQYAKTMKQVFDGSIQSYTQHVSVWSQLKRGFPATLSLSIGAAVIWLLIGVALGLFGALRAGRASDVALSTLSFVGISAPTFVVGAVLLYFLTFKTQAFPAGGYVPITSNPAQWAYHLILPWVSLAVLYIGIYAQVLRSSVLDALTTDAVRTAVAKGLSRRRVLVKHVLRVSLVPIVSLWGLDFAAVLGGSSLVVELVFNLNGIGQYTAQSVRSLDVPPVLVVTLLGAFFVILMNAIVDILYVVLDPRIRSESA